MLMFCRVISEGPLYASSLRYHARSWIFIVSFSPGSLFLSLGVAVHGTQPRTPVPDLELHRFQAPGKPVWKALLLALSCLIYGYAARSWHPRF